MDSYSHMILIVVLVLPQPFENETSPSLVFPVQVLGIYGGYWNHLNILVNSDDTEFCFKFSTTAFLRCTLLRESVHLK